MKKTLIFGLLALGVIACRPEPYEEIGQAYSVITGIDGKWDLSMVEVEDRSFPQWETMDISDHFVGALGSNEVSIDFDADARSYNISANNLDGLPFTSLNGTYAFDDEEYPSNLYLFTPGSSDTTTVALAGMVRAIDPELKFQELKSSCDEVYARYIYTFNRSN